MSTLTITRYPNFQYILGALFPVSKVNILRTVRSYLTPGEELTHDKALSVLRDIKWKSDIKAFLLHPISLITISLGVVPFLLIPATGIIMEIAFTALYFIGLAGLGMAVDSLILVGRSWEYAYKLQSERLSGYIVKLEENPKMKVKLGSMNPLSKAEMSSRVKKLFAQTACIALPAGIIASMLLGQDDFKKNIATGVAIDCITLGALAYKNFLELRDELR